MFQFLGFPPQPESSLFDFPPPARYTCALHHPHALQRGREGGIHCGTHDCVLTRRKVQSTGGAARALKVRRASYCKLTATTEAGALILAGSLLRSAVAGVRAGSP